MNVLVIGSGGREHAIVDTLARNPNIGQIYGAPGNGGIASQARLAPISAEDTWALVDFARQQRIDLTFVGPEVPLSLGIVDLFREHGLKIVGPNGHNARLESSKTFAKRFLKANGIPTAGSWECATAAEAYQRLEDAPLPIVVKADGLAAGKGVVVAETRDQARQAVRDFMEVRTMGVAGSRVLIEEFMSGEEASFLVFADGTTFHPMVVSQDHKRRFDGDAGPNTGGMGAYSIDRILTSEQHETVLSSIIRPTLEAAKDFTGILYAGLMLTPTGPRVVEFNVRFGDPEAQVILPRLKSDLLEILTDLADHRLASARVEWSDEVTATVVLVAGGYPGKYESGKRIDGLDEAARMNGVRIYHAGTREMDGKIYTAGGRVLNVTGRGGTLSQALDRAYAAAEVIRFEGKDYRRDIGKKGLAKEQP
ncbi:MAG TPA: phosphoribosylamine--glycine ligase [Terriglobia bacterium]|nr:phosphoribosylamine--glycine ligase [Terriglobia bacterium]